MEMDGLEVMSSELQLMLAEMSLAERLPTRILNLIHTEMAQAQQVLGDVSLYANS